MDAIIFKIDLGKLEKLNSWFLRHFENIFEPEQILIG
jgi:hypothetical protein